MTCQPEAPGRHKEGANRGRVWPRPGHSIRHTPLSLFMKYDSPPFSDPETRSEGGLNFVYNYSSRATFLACSNRALFRCAKSKERKSS